jgi:DMSO reductase anchor subunit
MHPAFSVIFFTVASGAGFGLFSLLFIADFFKLGGSFSNDQLVAGGLIALALVVFGLLSSTFHLANPKNAWRAFSRFRTSWLSREGVFAVVFMPLALI